jgi:phosphate starvation-inducible protein PhoH
LRGRTFKNAFIIADEMQNSSPNQMLMLTTRIGEGSKMVITGDLKQSDSNIESGLSDFICRFKKYNDFLSQKNKETNTGIQIVELDVNDIERSKVIKKLLEIYDFNINSDTKDNAIVIDNEVKTPVKIAKMKPMPEPKPRIHPDNDAALITEIEILRTQKK